MQRANGYVQAVVGRVILIGLSVQILFGLLWLSLSFSTAQWFADSVYYLQAGESMIFDEYTGILYPVLLRLAVGLERLIGIPLTVVIGLLQTAAVFGAGYCFLAAIGVKRTGFRVWGSLALLTFPMTAQCCLSVLPNALGCSVLLLQMACLFTVANGVAGHKAGRRQETMPMPPVTKAPVFGLYGLWVVESFLMPEYFWFGAVPAAAGTVLMLVRLLPGRKMQKEKRNAQKCLQKAGVRVVCLFLLVAMAAGVAKGTLSLVTEKGSLGRVEGSTEAAIFRRVAGSSLAKYYSRWPEEFKTGISQEILAQAIAEPETIATVLQPRMEEILGVNAAREWFGTFSEVVFWDNYMQILREMGWDLAGNLLPAVTVEEVLSGRGYGSLCSRNYETMRQAHPILTGNYLSYSSWWMAAGILLSLFAAALLAVSRFRNTKEGIEKAGGCKRTVARITLVSTAVFVALWYTLQGTGIWDYKQSLIVGGVWMTWMVCRSENSLN